MEISIDLKGKEIKVKIISQKRISPVLLISFPNVVELFIPYFIKEEGVKRLITEKEDWILNKLNLLKSINSQSKRSYLLGGYLAFEGKHVPIEAIIDPREKPTIEYKLGRFFMVIQEYDENQMMSIIINWYTSKAYERLMPIVNSYSKLLKVQPQSIEIENNTKQWARCSNEGNIKFNWRSMMVPEEVQEYIVVHELCHLKYMNHFFPFWKLVESVMQDYKEKKKWLDKYGKQLIK